MEIKIPDVNKLLNLKDKLSRQELSAFNVVSNKYVHLRHLNSLVTIKCIVTFMKRTEKVYNIIYLNPFEKKKI